MGATIWFSVEQGKTAVENQAYLTGATCDAGLCTYKPEKALSYSQADSTLNGSHSSNQAGKDRFPNGT